MTLVECVPNFSEGRDKGIVDAIVNAMKVPGVYLLDREMDSDHNRCVITLIGDREAIAEAAIRGVKVSQSKTVWRLLATLAKRYGSASRFQFICMKRQLRTRTARDWKTYVADNLKACVRTFW